MKLTKLDCEEIYYALLTKKAKIERGDYNPGGDKVTSEIVCKTWAKHLQEIIDKIGLDGSNLIGTYL